jgi:hypothetical protein
MASLLSAPRHQDYHLPVSGLLVPGMLFGPPEPARGGILAAVIEECLGISPGERVLPVRADYKNEDLNRSYQVLQPTRPIAVIGTGRPHSSPLGQFALRVSRQDRAQKTINFVEHAIASHLTSSTTNEEALRRRHPVRHPTPLWYLDQGSALKRFLSGLSKQEVVLP